MAAVLKDSGAAECINCSLGPDNFAIAKKTAIGNSFPVVVKANAGLPDPITNTYDLTADKFAESMKTVCHGYNGW